MVGALGFVLAVATVAIQYGWTPLPDGGFEYVVQIEPELMGTFEKEGYTSEVPRDLHDVRRIRVQVGRDPIPNRGVTVLKPPLDVPHLNAPPTTMYDSHFTLAGNQTPAADKRPTLKNMFEDEDTTGAKASKHSATDKPELTNAADESRTSRFNSPGKTNAYDSEFDPPSPSHLQPKPAGESNKLLSEQEGARPWLPLTLALVALFASIGGNLYLGWLHYGTRRQYQSVVDQLRTAEGDDAYPVELEKG